MKVLNGCKFILVYIFTDFGLMPHGFVHESTEEVWNLVDIVSTDESGEFIQEGLPSWIALLEKVIVWLAHEDVTLPLGDLCHLLVRVEMLYCVPVASDGFVERISQYEPDAVVASAKDAALNGCQRVPL